MALGHVATEDIQAGKGFFKDYGYLREEAGQDHIRDRQPEHPEAVEPRNLDGKLGHINGPYVGTR